MNQKVSEPAVTHGNHADSDYDGFLVRMQARFLSNINNGVSPLFTTDAYTLWTAYLETFGASDAPLRQYHTCHACRQFVDRFGGLVTVDATGMTVPAIWHEDDAPDAYRPAIAAMARMVRRAKVTGVFLSSDKVWGTPETGIWHHLAVTPPPAMLHKDRVLTAFQASASKAEDFKTVMYVLNEFTQPHIELALTLLKSDALYRSEKVLGQAEWLHGLHVARAAAHGSAKANTVWRAIATAPAGFCHPRSSMIGTLLEDIAAGKEFSEVSRAFAAKMHPLSYQRPQAAPKSGAIEAAEKLVEQMGIAPSLARRYARLDEVQALWQPKPQEVSSPAEGVFGHLKAKTSEPMSMRVPALTMTWDKFQRVVLPTAERIDIVAPGSGPYTSFTTAVNADAPPLLQWDREGLRNPVCWYFWHGGSTGEQFGLRSGTYCTVNAITLKPSMWNGGHEHQGNGLAFIIDGAKDSRNTNSALFPETMRTELHAVRSVIEAYSRSATLQDEADQSAAGLMFSGTEAWNAKLRVWIGGRSTDYALDRWD